MQKGYSHATISRNIAELVASGTDQRTATAKCLANARSAFFRKHPGGAIPASITYPGCGRLAQHYDAKGQPLKRNPARQRNSKVAQAGKLIQDFSGHKPRELGVVNFPENPGTAIAIGHVLGVAYETKRDGRKEKYFHRFTLKDSRPLLVVSPDGKQLFMIGGSYNFTERGIEDARSK